MAQKKKGIPLIAIIIAIAVIITLALAIYKNIINAPETQKQKAEKTEQQDQETIQNPYAKKAKTSQDIKIEESDTKEVKLEKTQGKLELMDQEIKQKQTQLQQENEKLNELYNQYAKQANEDM